jgi:glucose-6-phosphate isomerase
MDAQARLTALHAVERLAARDAALFADQGLAAERLGWVGLPEIAAARASEFVTLADAAMADGITDVVLLGMGGSSLAPLVLARSLPRAAGHPVLHVLDTTSPAQTRALIDSLDPATTLVIVSSKSGSSVEPLTLAAIFRQWLDVSLGERAADHLMVITDPGSPLAALAAEEGFVATILAPPEIGGRYSALSPFAMVPAAMTGIDIARLAATAETMEDACIVPGDGNPALALASWMTDALDSGRDKLHIVCSRPVESFGLWAEQLVAESTGKSGRGILPVLESSPGLPAMHGVDAATFILRSADDDVLASLPGRLPDGEPVFEVVIDDACALAAEFVHWEWAVALLCAVSGIECFGQPDVEDSKARTLAILRREADAPVRVEVDAGIRLHSSHGITTTGLPQAIAGLLALLPERGYLAVLAYLPEDEALLAPLRDACARVATALRMPVSLQLGPRYLHSTGQYHKGGPAEGAFFAITADDAADIPVPGSPFTLAELHDAQAAGDVAALGDLGLPVLAIVLPSLGALEDVTRAMTDAVRA